MIDDGRLWTLGVGLIGLMAVTVSGGGGSAELRFPPPPRMVKAILEKWDALLKEKAAIGRGAGSISVKFQIPMDLRDWKFEDHIRKPRHPKLRKLNVWITPFETVKESILGAVDKTYDRPAGGLRPEEIGGFAGIDLDRHDELMVWFDSARIRNEVGRDELVSHELTHIGQALLTWRSLKPSQPLPMTYSEDRGLGPKVRWKPATSALTHKEEPVEFWPIVAGTATGISSREGFEAFAKDRTIRDPRYRKRMVAQIARSLADQRLEKDWIIEERRKEREEEQTRQREEEQTRRRKEQREPQKRMERALRQFLAGGDWWIEAEREIIFCRARLYVPYLAGWKLGDRSLDFLEENPITVRPDWVCELSRTTTQRADRIKLSYYAAAGVGHTWVVDLDARTIEVYTPRDGLPLLVATATAGTVAVLPPFDLPINLNALLALLAPPRAVPKAV